MPQRRGHPADNEDAGPEPLRRAPLPFHRPWFDEREVEGVRAVLEAGQVGTGPTTAEFERQFARFVGARYAVAVNSSWAGIHLALEVIGVHPGDEVLTSVYGLTATAAAIAHLEARAVLVDIVPETLTLDPADLAGKISGRSRAIVPVHLGGAPCDMDSILAVAARHGLPVVEDAVHALPARYGGRSIGSIGDLTVFGFDPSLNITTGEGGMVTTDRVDYARELRARRAYGVADAEEPCAAAPADIRSPGYGYRMSDLNAAVGLEQLRKIEMFHGIRSYFAGIYQLGLTDLDALALPDPAPTVQHAWHLYVVRLGLERLGIDREAFLALLHAENIGAATALLPLFVHPYYREAFGCRADDFPRAREAFGRVVCLPLYPRLRESDVWDVIRAVRRIVRRHARAEHDG